MDAPDVEAHAVTSERNGQYWKWIAAILAAALLAGMPGYLYLYLNTPSTDDFERLRDRQGEVLEQLAVQEEINRISSRDRFELRQQIDQINEQLRNLRGNQ